MTTYICKCGRTFQKNTEAGTTGFRMPDYGPGHECYGCPFVCKVLTWDPVTQQQAVQNHECRGSKTIQYDTQVALSRGDKCVGRIYSLDLEFLHRVRDFADTLDGIEPDRYAFSDRPADYGDDGRFKLTIYPAQNNKGIAAKQLLFERFFNPDGSRVDVAPEQEKEIVLEQIRKAKEEVQPLNTYYAPCGQKFNRSAGRVPEVTIEVTGTTTNCFRCPHATHEPGDGRQGPKTFCVCTRRQAEPVSEEAKALAQGKTEPAEVGTKYYHHCLVYFVGKREDNGKYTVFLDDASNPGPDTLTEVATVPDFDTFDEAQNALDGLAIKRGFTTERSTPEKAPETEQPDDEQNDLDPDGMEELAEYQELTQADTAPAIDAPESGNDGAKSEGNADETPDSGDDTGDSADDGSEVPPQPCDWKNASGDGDGEQEQETEDPGEPLPEGPDLSLRLPEFDSLFAAADSSLRDLARAMKTKLIESGELAIKVVINNYGGVLKPDPKKCKVDCTPKPAKVSTVIHFPDDLEFSVEKDNRVIVPEDREHQINFDELQPGREISPTGTATVDGKTGIVESYQEDAAEDQAHGDPQGDLPEDEEPAEKLYPCENFDCPFYGLPDDGDAGCCYDQDVRDTRDPSIKSDVVDAVHFYRCTRPEVIQAFAEAHPDEDTDFEGDPDTQEDQPPYSDGEEINQEDDAS